MAECAVCGNDNGTSFEVLAAGSWRVFDRFECAVHALGRVCEGLRALRLHGAWARRPGRGPVLLLRSLRTTGRPGHAAVEPA
jgi:hypothetical protein